MQKSACDLYLYYKLPVLSEFEFLPDKQLSTLMNTETFKKSSLRFIS